MVPGGPRDYKDSHPTGAVLVVEIAESSLEYDRSDKASLYAEARIEDYWVVNLVDRQLEVYREPQRDSKQLYGHGYAQRTVLNASDRVTPLAAPQASLGVAELLP